MKFNPRLKHIFPFRKAGLFLKQYVGYIQGSHVKGSVYKSESPNCTDQQEQIISHSIPLPLARRQRLLQTKLSLSRKQQTPISGRDVSQGSPLNPLWTAKWIWGRGETAWKRELENREPQIVLKLSPEREILS